MAIFKKDTDETDGADAQGEIVYLTREQIDAVDDIQVEPIYVKEWGGWVRVRGLDGTARSRFEAEIAKNPKKMNLLDYQAKLVVNCLVDEQGNQLYGQREVANLGRKSASALNTLFEAAQRLSGLTDEDADELLGE